jgi:imidazole glycerol-phosphate synthase subunit HisF
MFLLSHGRLVKGTRFIDHIDVGDPISQAMIYDAQGADEIIIVDIDATAESRHISTDVIESMITKCRLPIAAGGGIRSVRDATRCFEAGADKIVLNTAAVLNPSLVLDLANEFGAQSVIVSIDVRRNSVGSFDIYTHSGRQKHTLPFNEFIDRAVSFGAGELIITSIDHEGTLSGFDHAMYNDLRKNIPVSFIASGGAGCYDDIVRLFKESDCDACALGKMLFLRDYDIVRIKSYLTGRKVITRDA